MLIVYVRGDVECVDRAYQRGCGGLGIEMCTEPMSEGCGLGMFVPSCDNRNTSYLVTLTPMNTNLHFKQ